VIGIAAWVFAGIALWFSRGVLDVFSDHGQLTRVAMLPSVPELFGLITLALIAAGGVTAAIRTWTLSSESRGEAFLQISLPLFGLLLLAVPYLPWLPDDIDPLRALAGPITKVIWFVVIGQVILTFVQMRSIAGHGRYSSQRIIPATIVVITVAMGIIGAAYLQGTLTGVALASNDAIVGPENYPAARWVLAGIAGTLAALTWQWVFAFTGAIAASIVSWAIVFLSAPMFFSGLSLAPDLMAAMCVIVALAWNTKPQQSETPWAEYLVRGLAVSLLPWLSIVYVPMAAAIAICLGLRAIRTPKAVLAFLVPFTISILRRLAAGHAPLQFGNPIVGIFGLLFDQEFGVLAYAPGLALGIAGLGQMVASKDSLVRRRGQELGFVVGTLALSAGALSNWWQTSAPPGRPLVAAIPLLALPVAWSYLRAPEGSVRRATGQTLALIGAAVTISMTFADHGALVIQDRDGSSRFLQWIVTLWPAWQAAPAVAANGLRASIGVITLWLLASVTIRWISQRNSLEEFGASKLMATVNLAAAVLVVALLAPAFMQADAAITEPEARSRLPMLDDFDSLARPHAIIYRPFTVARAEEIPPLMQLAAAPGRRTGGQPVQVLLNARYALAAGDYRVEIGDVKATSAVSGWVALQLGRIGAPLEEWPAELAPGGTWSKEFSLPVDAEFVGFVVSDTLASATSLRLTPLRIVNRNNRESSFHGRTRTVLSGLRFPSVSVLFHDENVYPERTGFWVHGGSTAYMTVAADHPDRGVTIRVHSGAAPNTVTFATTTWGAQVKLFPKVSLDVAVPAPARPGPFLLRVTTAGGFVPAETIGGNADRRILGCWIEVVQN